MKPGPKIVALIFPPNEQYGREVIEGVIEMLGRRTTWQVIDLPHQRAGRSPLPRGGLVLDGAITWCDAPVDSWLDDLSLQGVRIVNCGRGWIGHPRISNITVDRTASLHPLYEHFRSLGVKHLIAADYRLQDNPHARASKEGMVADAASYGMTGQVFDIGGVKHPSEFQRRIYQPEREEALLGLLRDLPPSCGMICGTDYIGALVCNVARLLGLRIPEDLAIACIGNNVVARIASPPLTSIAADGRRVGRVACHLLAKLLETGADGPGEIRLGRDIYLLHIRESTVGFSMQAEMERARRFIEDQAPSGISLGDLARVTGLSANTLVKNYRKTFGISPVDAIHACRIGEVKRLLRNTTLPVAEIATRCGFGSASGLYNYFARHTGIIPSAWRDGAENPPP